MTNKDVLKMLLISIQYVYDIKIDSYKTEDGTIDRRTTKTEFKSAQ